MRRLLSVLILVLFASACGGGDGGDETTADAPDAGDEATTTTTVSETTTTAAPETTTTTTTVPPTTTTDAPPAISAVPTPAASTVDELLALDRPVIAAHGGGDRAYPHSTMYAFIQAALDGVDVLEMDLQMTADGVLVVHHDATVDRRTETTGRVRDLTVIELQELDKAYWFHDRGEERDLPDDQYPFRGMRTGEVEPPAGYAADDFKIETFRTYATVFPDHVLDLEIKVPLDDADEPDIAYAIEAARVLADEIAELGRTDSVIVTSFSSEVMVAFREFAPDVATSPGEDEMVGWYLGTGELAEQDVLAQLPPERLGIDILDPELIARIQAEGVGLWIWPNSDDQENEAFYRSLFELGIDGVIAGVPAEGVAAIS
ncbi:MAG: glycerophosphodiester phosphodiesterase family protein [Actinomycetota bacterium]